MAAQDIITVFAALLFTFGLALFLINFSGNLLVDELLNNSAINSTNMTVNSLNSVKTSVTSRLDYIFLFVFVMFILIMFILAWLFNGNPVFVVLWIVVMVLSLVLSPILSNIWTAITESGGPFGMTISAFPITNHIISSLPLYVTVIGLAGLFLMFLAKKQLGSVSR